MLSNVDERDPAGMKRVVKSSGSTRSASGSSRSITGREETPAGEQTRIAGVHGRQPERAPPAVYDTSWLSKSAYMDLLARPALSVKQTAQIFGVGDKAVRTMCKDGVLEELRAGRLVRISTQSVRKLLGLHA